MTTTKHMGRVGLTGALLDRATQRWVIRTGREVAFADHEWLDGPVGSPSGIGEQWIAQHAARIGARVVAAPDGGLLPDLDALSGPGFRSEDVRAQIRAFYEVTAGYELDVWSRWRRWAEPGGRAINAMFATRLRQLSLPLDPLETAYGMTSRILSFRSRDGSHVGTAWQRRLRATGATVFGGFYGTTVLPGATRSSVRVVFPLPNGSLTVLLRAETTGDRALRLISPDGVFGGEGAYLVVRPLHASRGWVRRVPLPERFDVFVDGRGELRCDHQLWFGSAEVLRLHYRMRSSPEHSLR